ncbi:unnamed protein product [Rhizoctonia solani]|uniref:Ig-like domain-containing protein n=1 Tax=Rhizoctonia solani TaxID=456999 RepID=A0A8H3BDX4_9AGAM|nr:unnamed protein product [Rhizoctonia solani]
MKHIFTVLAAVAAGLQIVVASPTPLSIESSKLEKRCRAKGELRTEVPATQVGWSRESSRRTPHHPPWRSGVAVVGVLPTSNY